MAYPQGTQVPFSLFNGSNTPLDAKSIANNKAEALTLAKSARFIGLKIYLLDEKKEYIFQDGIEDVNFVPFSGGSGVEVVEDIEVPDTSDPDIINVVETPVSKIKLIGAKKNTDDPSNTFNEVRSAQEVVYEVIDPDTLLPKEEPIPAKNKIILKGVKVTNSDVDNTTTLEIDPVVTVKSSIDLEGVKAGDEYINASISDILNTLLNPESTISCEVNTDKDIVNEMYSSTGIINSITISAKPTKGKYDLTTIEFIDKDGLVLDTQTIDKEDPSKVYTYTYNGTITADTKFTVRVSDEVMSRDFIKECSIKYVLPIFYGSTTKDLASINLTDAPTVEGMKTNKLLSDEKIFDISITQSAENRYYIMIPGNVTATMTAYFDITSSLDRVDMLISHGTHTAQDIPYTLYIAKNTSGLTNYKITVSY